MASRAEVTTRYARAYVQAGKASKGRILDEVVSVTGWSRENARRRLTAAAKRPPGVGRPVATVARKPRSPSTPTTRARCCNGCGPPRAGSAASDEHAFRGVKEDRAGGDDAVRPAFPAEPGDLSSLGRPVYDLHQELIGLRRRHRWLHTARTAPLHLANEQLVYEARAGEDRLVVALSVTDRPAELPAPGAGAGAVAGARLGGPRRLTAEDRAQRVASSLTALATYIDASARNSAPTAARTWSSLNPDRWATGPATASATRARQPLRPAFPKVTASIAGPYPGPSRIGALLGDRAAVRIDTGGVGSNRTWTYPSAFPAGSGSAIAG